RVGARPTVALAGDEIDERRFLGLLQLNPHSCWGRIGARRASGPGDPSNPSPRIRRSIARRSPTAKREIRLRGENLVCRAWTTLDCVAGCAARSRTLKCARSAAPRRLAGLAH